MEDLINNLTNLKILVDDNIMYFIWNFTFTDVTSFTDRDYWKKKMFISMNIKTILWNMNLKLNKLII